MSKFIKIINACAPSGPPIDKRDLPDGGICSPDETKNFLLNLDEVSNISLKTTARNPYIEVVAWTTKIGFTWRFTDFELGQNFYKELLSIVPVINMSSKLKGFSSAA